MNRWTITTLALAMAAGACDDSTEPQVETQGLTFNSSGTQPFAASGSPSQDPGTVLAGSFALAFADSLDGAFAIGYSPTGANVGDILILQFPRQVGTNTCGRTDPCHGWLFTDVRLTQNGGLTLWFSDKSYEITSGSLITTQVGPAVLRGSFQTSLQEATTGETIAITNGTMDVSYNPTPPAPGQSWRGVECVIKLALGQVSACS